MRIALDARTIYRPNRRGTGKNLIDLYRALSSLKPDWRVIALHRQGHDADPHRVLLPAAQTEPRHIDMPGDRFDAWGLLRLPVEAWRRGADVLHCPANECPIWMPVPTVVTIHDLIPLDMATHLPPAAIRRFEQSVRTACRKATWIICPSLYTRDRLVERFGADRLRITVNPWAADSAMRHVDEAESKPVAARYGVNGRFVLHLGAAEPRKNTRRMLQAWALLSNANRNGHELLVVGLDDATQGRMSEWASELGVSASVKLHGFAGEADMPALLSAATVLAYPSLSEGFGLPILDAWTTGAAVLAANATSLPEVAGDAAELVDPTDANALAAGLANLLTNETHRRDLVALGRQKLEIYSWRATAERFIWTMEQAIKMGRQTKDAA